MRHSNRINFVATQTAFLYRCIFKLGSYGGKRLSMITWALRTRAHSTAARWSTPSRSTLKGAFHRTTPVSTFSFFAFQLSLNMKTGTNLFHGVGRFSYFPARVFHSFGFGLKGLWLPSRRRETRIVHAMGQYNRAASIKKGCVESSAPFIIEMAPLYWPTTWPTRFVP